MLNQTFINTIITNHEKSNFNALPSSGCMPVDDGAEEKETATRRTRKERGETELQERPDERGQRQGKLVFPDS